MGIRLGWWGARCELPDVLPLSLLLYRPLTIFSFAVHLDIVTSTPLSLSFSSSLHPNASTDSSLRFVFVVALADTVNDKPRNSPKRKSDERRSPSKLPMPGRTTPTCSARKWC